MLPNIYQEVEYIIAKGKQYIKTGFTANQDTSIEMKITTTTLNANAAFYCSRKTLSNNTFACFRMNGQLRHDYGKTQSDTSYNIQVNTPYKIYSNKNKLYINDSLIHTSAYTNFQSPYDMLLLASQDNSENAGANYWNGNLYYCKIWDNNTLIRDFIPCYRKSDNVVGMYDIINNLFYTNKGTGSFIAGPDVKEDSTKNIKSEIDWSDSMEQTFEYYEVDPNTWKDTRQLNMVKKCTIKRDEGTDTLGSALIDINDTLGECYIRVYLVIRQNGGTYKYVLGTFLVQTPSSDYDGKNRNVSMDSYTPLLELKENPPPLGFSLLKGENIMKQAYLLTRNNCRAPVIETVSDQVLQDNFVADPNETWLSYISYLISQAKYKFYLDDNGKILFAPKQKVDELQPVWTYNDDNSSILYPEISMKHDLYGIPNVVEVICSTGTKEYTAVVENNDPNSPTSIQNRGRRILYREDNPNLPGIPTEDQIDEYAKNLLESLSSVEYEISYTHAYCPVRVGDAVRLNYKRAGLEGIKAKVISQSIRCENGCSVNETAVFTKKLWN